MKSSTSVGQISEVLASAGFVLPAEDPTKWVGSVIPAALWAVRPDLESASEAAGLALGVEPAKQAIVVMVDGLGVEPLSSRLSYARNLRGLTGSLEVGQSTLPSTTAAALTAFTTGAMPASTRMVGYAVRRSQQTMTLLNFAPDVVVEEWQAVPTAFESAAAAGVRSRIITKPKFHGSGLTRAAFRGSEFVGRENLHERFNVAIEGAVQGVELQVVYWSEIDHVGHKLGAGSPEWAQQVEAFDSALGQFLSRVPSGTLVLLTADHGMVDVGAIIDVAETPALLQGVPIIAGEGRAVHLHAEPGEEAAVLDRWTGYLDGIADVVRTADLPQLLGTGPGLENVGVGMVFLRGDAVILDSRTQSSSVFAMRGVHGSYSEAEMAIPLWRLA